MRTKESAAIATLEALGYSYNGGMYWKPPIGKVPQWALEGRAPTKPEAYVGAIEPLLKTASDICSTMGMSMIFTVHTPTDEEPRRCEALIGLCDDAPETMQTVYELVKSRPVLAPASEPPLTAIATSE